LFAGRILGRENFNSANTSRQIRDYVAYSMNPLKRI
jgi:hypothetical protein